MNASGLIGLVCFALGGVFVLGSLGIITMAFSNSFTTSDWLLLGFALAFLGFVLLGTGLQSIIKSAKQEPKQKST